MPIDGNFMVDVTAQRKSYTCASYHPLEDGEGCECDEIEDGEGCECDEIAAW